MNQIWLQIFAVMIGGSILKYFFYNVVLLVLVDLAILGICFLILRRHPYVDVRKSMLFLGALTLISVLVDLGVNALLGQIAMLALVGWMMFGGNNNGNGRRRPPLRHKWNK